MGTLGADVSHWNSSTPTTGLTFLIVKASEGTAADAMYSTHVGRGLSRGLLIGAYHFCRDDTDIDAQAKFFVQHATGAKALVVDNEGAHSMSKAQIRNLIMAIRKYDSLHRHVGLYMSEKAPFYLNVGADFNWVANYSAVPTISWHIHQYTSSPYDKDRARNQAVVNSIFQVPPPIVSSHTVHVAHNAKVRIYRLGATVISGQRCIRDWVDVLWPGPSSHAACTTEVTRRTCNNASSARTVQVLDGKFAGKIVRVGAAGVTYS